MGSWRGGRESSKQSRWQTVSGFREWNRREHLAETRGSRKSSPTRAPADPHQEIFIGRRPASCWRRSWSIALFAFRIEEVFFCNSGARRMKAPSSSRAMGAAGRHPCKVEIVALRGSFHGRLFASLTRRRTAPPIARHSGRWRVGSRFVRGTLPTSRRLSTRRQSRQSIVEPIQGEGESPRVLDSDFPCRACASSRRNRRSPSFSTKFSAVSGAPDNLFAYENVGVVPDMLTLAKPLAGGARCQWEPFWYRRKSRPRSSRAIMGRRSAVPYSWPPSLPVLDRVSDPSLLSAVREKRGHGSGSSSIG